jgi:hypothetical protein
VRRRFTVVAVAVALALLALPAVARAWCNGPSGADGFGTHDWILQEAECLAAGEGAGWVDLKAALPHTDDPDTVFHDFYYHVYDVWGSRYGNAPNKVAEYYAKALKARKAGDITAASRYVGVMAHYFGDIGNPMHTDQCAAEDSIHSEYESDAQGYTDEVGENRVWVRFDGYQARTSVAGFTQRVAGASHKYYSTLVKDYAASGMSSAVLSITARRLGAAANGLADLIIGLKRGVGGGASASGGGGGGGGGDGGGGSSTVYITRTGEKYHRSGCRYLSSSKIAISLADAKARGYTPCSVCDPPR